MSIKDNPRVGETLHDKQRREIREQDAKVFERDFLPKKKDKPRNLRKSDSEEEGREFRPSKDGQGRGAETRVTVRPQNNSTYLAWFTFLLGLCVGFYLGLWL